MLKRSKKDAKNLDIKLNEKFDLILENQKNMKEIVEKLETEFLEKNESVLAKIESVEKQLLETQKSNNNINLQLETQNVIINKSLQSFEIQYKDTRKMYEITNQLLLKDLLDTHKEVVEKIISKEETKNVVKFE